MMKPVINEIISFFASIVTLYLDHKSHRIELMKHTKLRLRKNNKTRWNSVVIMLERINEIKDALNQVATVHEKVKISDERWIQLTDLLYIFNPFKALTDKLQSDSALLSVIYVGFNNICEHIKNVSSRLHSYELKIVDWKCKDRNTSILENIRMRYQDNIDSAAVTAVQLLTRGKARETMKDIEPDEIKQKIFSNMSRLVGSNIIEKYA